MKIYPFRAAAGFLTLFLSAVLLLTTANVASWSIWLSVWQFWPLLFVVFGAAFLMRRWHFNFFLGMTVFIAIFAILGGGLWLSWKDRYFDTENFAEENTKGITETKISNEMPKKIDEADVKIMFGTSNIRLNALESSESSFLYDGGHSSNFFTLNQKMELVGDKAKLTFKSSPFIKKPFNSKSINELNLGFSQKLDYSFDIQTGSSDLNLDFEKMKVKNLDIDAGASKIAVRFNRESSTDVKLKSGASSLKLYIPKDSGIKIAAKSALTSNNFEEINLVKTKSGWESKDLDKSEKRINIELKSGVSKVELVRY